MTDKTPPVEDKNPGATNPTSTVVAVDTDEPKYIEEARQAFLKGNPKQGFVYRFGQGGKLHVRKIAKKD